MWGKWWDCCCCGVLFWLFLHILYSLHALYKNMTKSFWCKNVSQQTGRERWTPGRERWTHFVYLKIWNGNFYGHYDVIINIWTFTRCHLITWIFLKFPYGYNNTHKDLILIMTSTFRNLDIDIDCDTYLLWHLQVAVDTSGTGNASEHLFYLISLSVADLHCNVLCACFDISAPIGYLWNSVVSIKY